MLGQIPIHVGRVRCLYDFMLAMYMPSWHENDGVHSFACYYNKPQSKITTFEIKTYFERHTLTTLIV